jgi:hypothetical protein
LALGVLFGRERAEMAVHLQRCERCQHYVWELATTARRLVELVPEVGPPAGFEQRALAAIASASSSAAATAAELIIDQTDRLVTVADIGEQHGVAGAQPRACLGGRRRLSGRGSLASAGVLAGVCALLASGAALAADQSQIDAVRGGGVPLGLQQPSIRHWGQHHHQRMPDGWYYLIDQQRAGDFRSPSRSYAPK